MSSECRVPSTEYRVPSTECPAHGRQPVALSTRYPPLSTRYSALGTYHSALGTALRRKSLALLQLAEQAVNLLLPFERREAVVKRFADQLGVRLGHRLLLHQLMVHAVEGGVG